MVKAEIYGNPRIREKTGLAPRAVPLKQIVIGAGAQLILSLWQENSVRSPQIYSLNVPHAHQRTVAHCRRTCMTSINK